MTSDKAEMLAEFDVLNALRAEFPAYSFWREQMPGRARYIARSLHFDMNPHTVITADLGELRRTLRPAAQVSGLAAASQATQGIQAPSRSCPATPVHGVDAGDLRARTTPLQAAIAGLPVRIWPDMRERSGPRRAGPRRRDLLDLIWKIDCSKGRWSATSRNDPSLVVTADNGDNLARLVRDLTLAILEGRGKEALRAMMPADAA